MTSASRLSIARAAAIVLATSILMAPRATTAQVASRAPVAATPHFVFYSEFSTNLNDALIASGAARRTKKTELFQAGPEQACFETLGAVERAAWNRAVDYYADVVSAAQFTALVQVLPRLELAGVVKKEELTDAAERRLLDITNGFRAAAAPAYERCRWPAQDDANQRWIETFLPLLKKYESRLGELLPKLYGTPWAGLPFRVDVVETVSYAGADSINLREPGLHILMSSSALHTQGRGALEMVFHEASHFLTGRNTPLPAALAAAARNAGGADRGDLTHPVQFFMTGEAVRRVLQNAGEPPYTPSLFALNLFSPEFRDAIRRTWPAYMDGKRTLEGAAADLMKALSR